MINLEDIECIRQVRAGNTDAFTAIVKRYKNVVFNIICKIIGDKQQAEDVTQEVFIKVFQSLNKFREESKFSTWLYSVTYNAAVSVARKTKNKPLLFNAHQAYVGDDELTYELDELGKEERLQCLEKVLRQLPVEDSLLITLYYIEDQPIAGIADITGLSQSNVKTRLHRIRKYMNFELTKLLQER